MISIKTFFKTHFAAFLMATLVGIVIVAPNFLLLKDFKISSKNLIPIPNLDSDYFFYLSRISAVQEGNLTATESVMKGTLNEPYVNPPGAEIFAGMLGKIFGLSMGELVILSNFLFPFLLALALYGIAFLVTKNSLTSIFPPLVILLASSLVFEPANLFNIFKWEKLWLNVYNRPVHPQISSLFFYFWFFALILSTQNRKKIWTFLAGISFSILFYIYPFSWTLASGTLGLLLIINLIKKDFGAAKNILKIILVGLIMSIPYWINFLNLVNHPLYSAVKERQVLLPSREPVFSKLLFLDIILCGIYLWLTKNKALKPNSQSLFRHPSSPPQGGYEGIIRLITRAKSAIANFAFYIRTAPALLSSGDLRQETYTAANKSIFLLLFTPILTLWVLINQQIITGYKLFPGHWHWYYIVPFSILLALVVIFEFLKKRKILKMLLFAIIAVVALSNGILSQKTYYSTKSQSEFETLQRYSEVFGWLNQNVPRGSVIFANDFFSTWLPVYTSHFRYAFMRTDELYLIDDERIKYTFFVKLRLFGVGPENIDLYLNQNTPELDTILSGYYRRYSENCNRCYTTQEIKDLQQKYLEFLKLDLSQIVKKYEFDYIVEDEKNDQMVDLAKDQTFSLIKEISGLKIYKIN